MDFFTADLHFFHRRMAELRGFDNCVDKMNDTLVRNWNDRVARGDRVFMKTPKKPRASGRGG